MSGDVRISRLALRVAGLDSDAATALARLVAQGLAPGMLAQPGTAALDVLRVEVRPTVAEHGCPDLLARSIIVRIQEALGDGTEVHQ
jgi:hypothetical protein